MRVKTITRRVVEVDVRALYAFVGQRFKAARKKAKLTQSEAARALGMSRTNLANIEGALPQRILLEHVYNAALLFRCSAKDLLP